MSHTWVMHRQILAPKPSSVQTPGPVFPGLLSRVPQQPFCSVSAEATRVRLLMALQGLGANLPNLNLRGSQTGNRVPHLHDVVWAKPGHSYA